jgi:hypothetical protein
MSKMKQGKTIEMESHWLLQTVEIVFGELGKSVENLKYNALGAIW